MRIQALPADAPLWAATRDEAEKAAEKQLVADIDDAMAMVGGGR